MSDEKLKELLNDVPAVEGELVPKQEMLPVEHIENDAEMEEDFSDARKSLKDLVVAGEDAVEGILKVAKESHSPRAYEVAAKVIQTTAETIEKVAELQRKKKEIKKIGDGKTQRITVDKAIFVGTSSDMIKRLEEREKLEQEKKNAS